MNLKQALEVLAREQHNGHTRWDGTCPPGNPAWRTEFEVIAIAEAYERKRGPDPWAALREAEPVLKIAVDALFGLSEHNAVHTLNIVRAAIGQAGENKPDDR